MTIYLGLFITDRQTSVVLDSTDSQRQLRVVHFSHWWTSQYQTISIDFGTSTTL